MREQLTMQPAKELAPTAIGANGRLLQRKCGCGNHTMSGKCDDCAKKKSSLQRKATNETSSSEVPTTVHEVPRSSGEPLNATRQALIKPRFVHDFSRIRAHDEVAVQHRDAADGTEGTASPDETEVPGTQTSGPPPSAGTETGTPPKATPVHTEGSGATATCPSKAAVDTVTNKTADGVKYRTGMGAVTTMKVEPDSGNWDGTNIVESFPTGITSDCPKEFGISPCAGNSTFIVGAARNSPVFGALPATKNRFYDFHETRWKGGSLLHDRNPAGLASCTISCEQNYSCGGAVIGKPTITRTFAKGKVGTVDVTNVNVSKT